MQYQFDFVSTTVLQGLTGLYDYFLVAVMLLWRFKSIQGWDIWEIGLLYAVSRVGWGLYRTVGEELDKFEGYIVRGDFDSVLLRPWPSLFVLMSRNFDLTKLGWIAQGLAIGIISIARLSSDGRLTVSGTIQLVLACVWSAGLYWAVGVATASAAFKIVRIEELQVFTENATGTATLYPLEIFPNWLRYFLLTVIPLGVGNYIPVRVYPRQGGHVWNLIIPPLVTVLCIWVSNLLWHAGNGCITVRDHKEAETERRSAMTRTELLC
jgi:ABC-2 type transport system permease protein